MNFVGVCSTSNTTYVLNDMATIQKLKKAAAAPKDMEVTDHGRHGRTIRFSTGAYMTVVSPMVKDWKDILATGDFINEDLVDNLKIYVVQVHTERDTKNHNTQVIIKLNVEGHEVTVTCYDTRLSMQVQGSAAMLGPYCSRALLPYLEQQIKENRRRIKETNAMVRNYDSGQTTTRRQAQEQLSLGKSDSFLTPPRRQQEQLDLAASQLMLENVTSDDSIVELISLDEEVVQLVAAPEQVQEPAQSEVVQEPARVVVQERVREVVREPAREEVVQEPAQDEVVQEPGPTEVVQEMPPQEMAQEAPCQVVQEASRQEVVQEAPFQEVVQEAPRQEVMQEAPRQEMVQEVGYTGVITTRSQVVPDLSFLDRLNGNVSLDQTEDRAGEQQPGLPPPISSTPAPPRRIFASDEADRNFLQQLEETISPLMETCKICQKKLRSTDALQDHILADHCTQSETLIYHMEQQKIMISNLLLAQETQHRQLTCIASDVTQMKKTATKYCQ